MLAYDVIMLNIRDLNTERHLQRHASQVVIAMVPPQKYVQNLTKGAVSRAEPAEVGHIRNIPHFIHQSYRHGPSQIWNLLIIPMFTMFMVTGQ